MYVPVHLVLPCSHGGGHDKVAKLLELRRRLDLERKTRRPLGHTLALSHAKEAGKGAPECAESSLADALVGVVDQLEELGDSLLKVGQVLAAGVSDDIAEDLGGNLLLHSDGSDALKVIPVVVVNHSLVQVLEVIIIVLTSGHDLDLLTLDGDLLADKLAGVLTELDIGTSLVLVKALVKALDSASRRRG